LVVRSFRDFTQLIAEKFGPFEIPTICDLEITFDHDLGIEPDATENYEKSGYDCAKWLVDQNIIPQMFWVHSANPVGSQNIISLLNNWYKHNGISTIGTRTFWQLVDAAE
jgi:hypothetical protein